MPVQISPRQDLISYCMRNLGAPVITINVDEDQVNDRVDEGLAFFHEHHDRGNEIAFYRHPSISQYDINNKFISVDENIISVTRVFNLQDKLSSLTNIFDLRYQLRLNEMWDFTSASFLNYQMTMQHLQTLNILFSGEIPFSFSEYEHKCHIHWAWGSTEAPIGTDILLEVYKKVSPEEAPDLYKDRWLRKYTTALIKRQWGSNLSKYDETQMVGGVRLRGGKIYMEAQQEVLELEEECINKYSRPMPFYTG